MLRAFACRTTKVTKSSRMLFFFRQQCACMKSRPTQQSYDTVSNHDFGMIGWWSLMEFKCFQVNTVYYAKSLEYVNVYKEKHKEYETYINPVFILFDLLCLYNVLRNKTKHYLKRDIKKLIYYRFKFTWPLNFFIKM